LTIISGGQTGADRAALDFAMQHGFPHGGWCPAGRLAEDGCIAARYQLRETPGSVYEQRTEWNVRDSDGTVIVSRDARLYGGSLLTAEFARRLRKPLLHLHAGNPLEPAGKQLRRFIAQHAIRVLNVAGPRASSVPNLEAFVKELLAKALLPLL
jgi:hypothetical protein